MVGCSVTTFRYYQYKLENPRSSEAVEAYEDTSLLPLKDYQRKRILTFLAPEVEDPNGVGANWNRIQALIAVATGGISGKGLGGGMQAKLGYLPKAVAHNDFIFAVLAEESGLLGCLLALGAFFMIIFGCLKVAAKAADRFGAMLAVGVSVLLMMHVFINVGMTSESLRSRVCRFLSSVTGFLPCNLFRYAWDGTERLPAQDGIQMSCLTQLL